MEGPPPLFHDPSGDAAERWIEMETGFDQMDWITYHHRRIQDGFMLEASCCLAKVPMFRDAACWRTESIPRDQDRQGMLFACYRRWAECMNADVDALLRTHVLIHLRMHQGQGDDDFRDSFWAAPISGVEGFFRELDCELGRMTYKLSFDDIEIELPTAAGGLRHRPLSPDGGATSPKFSLTDDQRGHLSTLLTVSADAFGILDLYYRLMR